MLREPFHRLGFQPGERHRWPRWQLALGLWVAVATGVGIAAVVVADVPAIRTDSALFQHTGWYITRGAVPYVDVWDINPPVVFAITAALAVVADGNMLVLHVLSVALTVAVTAVGVLLVGSLGDELTGDDASALAAGLVMLALPELYGLAAFGIRSQNLSFFFGTVALVAVLRDRSFLAGASAAASAGVWQPGGFLVVLVAAMAADRGGRRRALASLAGSAVVTAVVVAPFVLAGAFEPMVVQTIVAPIVGSPPTTAAGRLTEAVLSLGYATVLLPLAVAGWGVGASSRRAHWWVPAGGVVYAGQVLFVNNDGTLDVVFLMLFAALGVALAVREFPSPHARTATLVALAFVVVVAPLWPLAVSAPLEQPVEDLHERTQPSTAPPNVEAQQSVPPMREIYWEKRQPDRCHYRLSWTELRWIDRTDASLDARTCDTGWQSLR